MTFDVLLAKLRHASNNWWKVNKNRNLIEFSCSLLLFFQVFLRSFRDPIRVLGIRENRVPTGPFRVSNIFLKKPWLFWGISFSWIN